MARGIERRLRVAYKRVSEEIRGNSKGGKYAAGLATEGWAGGYRQALDDVSAMLRGVPPGDPRFYWEQEMRDG